MNNYAYLAAGIAIGVAVVFYQVDTPRADRCETYKVAAKVATAYVLKPPPAEVVYKACPQVTKVEPAPEPEVVKQEDPVPRHHRHHHRVRRYWR
jgi:hypothetical protein